jgi:molybdopterin-guanine dinucleotide biosynthesis protein A
MPEALQTLIDSVTPIVLCGGRSSRFGSDKLRFPLRTGPGFVGGSEWLIDRPVSALRSVFGNRVMLVGSHHPDLSERADGELTDLWPGKGPLGAIVSAFEALKPSASSIFVLSGDLPGVSPRTVRAILAAFAANTSVAAVLAKTSMIQPCTGIYTQTAMSYLGPHVNAERSPPLHSMVPAAARTLVEFPDAELRGVNRPEDLLPADFE